MSDQLVMPELASQQSLFEAAARHMFAQGHRSMEPFSNTCLYRGANGDKCVVGRFILDQDYQRTMEHNSFLELMEKDFNLDYLRPFWTLFSDLQDVHDGQSAWVSTESMQSALGRVAQRHGLEPMPIADLKFKDR